MVDDLSFFDYSSPFCLLLIEFHYTFPISCTTFPLLCLLLLYFDPPGGSEWIISVGDYVDNSFTALGSSDHREVRLEL